jgi:membrane associated rhomboid family serine protease
MIPLRDTIRSKTTPVVNYILIGICGLVFLYELSHSAQIDTFVQRFAIIPVQVSPVLFHGHVSPGAVFSLFTSMFLHGGWLHLMGNMLYLYIFGDNIEDRLGHIGYLFFYILSGIGAGLVEVYFNRHSSVPLIGASGAIAGVLGAYFLLFPRARVLTMIPLLIFFPVIEVSAFFFLGFWFILQFLQGSLSAGAGVAGGVAWWAHAGGFVIGALLLPLFLVARRLLK